MQCGGHLRHCEHHWRRRWRPHSDAASREQGSYWSEGENEMKKGQKCRGESQWPLLTPGVGVSLLLLELLGILLLLLLDLFVNSSGCV